MSNNATAISTICHPEYLEVADELEKIRVCTKGGFFVKKSGNKYLPHPSQIDTTSDEAISRYARYLQLAQYEDIPKTTIESWLGKLQIDDATLEFPEKLKYLKEDVDNNGLSVKGLAKNISQKLMQYNYHFLVVDYKGLENADTVTLTQKQMDNLKPRATIMQYPRSSLVDWNIALINGSLQFDYLLFLEVKTEFDHSSQERRNVERYLKLALDEDGKYYQQATTITDGDENQEDRNYQKVEKGEKNLDFIPVVTCLLKEFGGQLPQELGPIHPIVELCLSRYQTSAVYFEALHDLPATMFISGIDERSWEQFKRINGRDYIAKGASGPNVLPSDNSSILPTVEMISSGDTLEQYHKEFERNEKQIRSIGGVFPSDDKRQWTATEVINESEDSAARLSLIASGIEDAIKTAVSLCAMFDGLISKNEVDQYKSELDISLPRNFQIRKLSVEEVKELRAHVLEGLPKDVFIDLLVKGGWYPNKAEALKQEWENGVDNEQI